MDEPSEVYYQIYSFLKLSINFFFLSVLQNTAGWFLLICCKVFEESLEEEVCCLKLPKKQLFANSPQRFLQSCLNKAEISKAKGKKQPPVVFYKKGVLKDFAKFTRKHLSKIFFLTKLQAWGVQLC